MSQNQQDRVTKCRDEMAVSLQQYANNKRNANQFNNVTIVAGSERIPANTLVLSCYSMFFESMFLLPLKERDQNEIEIHQFDGRIIRSLIDYMYSGRIRINNANVKDVLRVADFLLMDDVKLFCFNFMEDNLSIDNCFDLIKLSTKYNYPSPLKATDKLISENFDKIAQTDAFRNLSKSVLISLISKLHSVHPATVYKAILSWTLQNESRKVDFTELFHRLDLQALSFVFLEEVVSKEPLVKENIDCLNSVLAGIFAKLKEDDWKLTKIFCANGFKQRCVFEVDSIGCIAKTYPQVPTKPQNHCMVKMADSVYCIGGYCEDNNNAGRSNKVFQLRLSEPVPQWKEVASMAERRGCFSAALFNGILVVNGNDPVSNTTEMYDAALDRWTNIAATNKYRAYHSLVATEGSLFAVGGYDNLSLSSVERLDDINGQWREVQPLKTSRRALAAVAYQGFIFAIGGYSTKREKSVEKYDTRNNSWTDISPMNVARCYHAACVMQGKIYVVGGFSATGEVAKSIECYDSKLDEWKIVGETKVECSNHAVVAI